MDRRSAEYVPVSSRVKMMFDGTQSRYRDAGIAEKGSNVAAGDINGPAALAMARKPSFHRGTEREARALEMRRVRLGAVAGEVGCDFQQRGSRMNRS